MKTVQVHLIIWTTLYYDWKWLMSPFGLHMMSSETRSCTLQSICPKFWYDLKGDTACLCTKFRVFWINEIRVMGQRSWRIFYHVIWEMGWWAFFCPSTWLLQSKCIMLLITELKVHTRNYLFWTQWGPCALNVRTNISLMDQTFG